MKIFTSIVIGSATDDTIHIHFRETTFLTPNNRSRLEKCVCTFIRLPIPEAFHDLVMMTCCPKNELPKDFCKKINLDPELVPNQAWDSFVNELRHQYKITNPSFMTEFTVHANCSVAYEALVSGTSEVAAYMFYKKANTFLYDHIMSDIGQQHISDTLNRLNWHSKNPEANRTQQIRALRKLSLRDYEAIYYHAHLEKCITLLQCMLDSIKMREPWLFAEPTEKVESSDDDLPFFFGDSTPTGTTKSTEKSYLDLSLENILEHETDFLGYIVNGNESCKNRLFDAGFDMEHVISKSFAIYWVIHTHNEMAKAVEALSK